MSSIQVLPLYITKKESTSSSIKTLLRTSSRPTTISGSLSSFSPSLCPLSQRLLMKASWWNLASSNVSTVLFTIGYCCSMRSMKNFFTYEVQRTPCQQSQHEYCKTSISQISAEKSSNQRRKTTDNLNLLAELWIQIQFWSSNLWSVAGIEFLIRIVLARISNNSILNEILQYKLKFLNQMP